ncbi:ankyrin repeat-containing domain protein [Diaporthe sp. PMI_573]|nr:ankyrin repeat-containing domain protein [Diaporthaceae sp. PMI_573]
MVRLLLGKGVNFGTQDLIDALRCRSVSVLSKRTQIELIRATPDLERMQIPGQSLLELCSLKFHGDALRETLHLCPAAYDSGALTAIVLRALKRDLFRDHDFRLTDVQTLVRRRTEDNCDWERENTTLLVAVMFSRPDILSILVTPGTTSAIKVARIPKEAFSSFLDPRNHTNPLKWMDPTDDLGCRDWVACSPLMGIAATPDRGVHESLSDSILNCLLACSYEPDALTVVIAVAKGNLRLLGRLQCLASWPSILSIDDHDRHPWCPTALQVAASNENAELVELLLEAGVSANEMPAKEPMGYCAPRTALQAAVDKGNLRLTTLLIDRGACINAPAAEDSGGTALQLACIHGYLEISRLLLEHGADVNAWGAQKHGRTALEGAAEHGRIDTIQLLLNYGACTDGAYREQYMRAVLYARKNRHFAAAALLAEHREWSAEDDECYKNLQAAGLDDEQEGDVRETNSYGIDSWGM